MNTDISNRVKMLVSRHLSAPGDNVEPEVLHELTRLVHRAYGAEVLQAIKEPLKHGVPLMQLKTIVLLDTLIRNTPPEFVMMVANEEWTERLFRAAKTTTSNDVADRIMTAALGWFAIYPVGGLDYLVGRFRESKVVGQRFQYLENEFRRSQAQQQQQRQLQQQQQQQQQQAAANAYNQPSPVRQGQYVDPAAGTAAAPAAAQRNASSANRRQPQRVNLDTLLMDAQGDMAALEYGIQHPDMLSEDTARDCAKHKVAISRLLENPAVEVADEERNTCLLVLEQLVTLLGFHDAMFGTEYCGVQASSAGRPREITPRARDADDDDADLQAALRESSMMANSPQPAARQAPVVVQAQAPPQAQPAQARQAPRQATAIADDFDVFASAPNPSAPTFGSPAGPQRTASSSGFHVAAALTQQQLAELEEQRRQASALSGENSALQARLRTTEQEKADLDAELAKTKASCENLTKKLAAAKQKNAEAVAAGMELDTQLQSVSERNRQLEEALKTQSSAPPPPPEIREVIREVRPKVDSQVLKRIQSDFTSLRALQSSVRKDSRTFATYADEFVATFSPKIDQIFAAAFVDRQKDQAELKALQNLYKKEVMRRKEYYNQIQELKGNIRVYCRIRPMSSK